MKIDHSNNRPAQLTESSAAANAQAPRRAPQNAGQGNAQQENVQLSGLSTQIQALETSIADASGIDTAKVEAIKQAISEGRFSINAEAIADKLIASTREMLAKQGG